MPEPQERERYQKIVERGVIELTTNTPGRLMVLFSSYTQLRQSAATITARLALGNIPVFDQSDGTAQAALLSAFKETPHGVLLGIRGYWDEDAFAADLLDALAIVRLPFAVPNDPIVATRGEAYGNSFDDYTLPSAVLRFRQSVATLADGRTRRGVLAVFDRRMTSKAYGQEFLDDLPPSEVRRAPMAELGAAARAWLSEG
jgi:DNA polymerase-3 subunit epsilon/ATP-dependent DNA helicase DinG